MKSRTELFQDFVTYFTVFSSKRYPNVPGGVINACNSTQRKELSELKSEDIGENLSYKEYWQGILQNQAYFYDQKWKKLKVNFDKKILSFANKKE